MELLAATDITLMKFHRWGGMINLHFEKITLIEANVGKLVR